MSEQQFPPQAVAAAGEQIAAQAELGSTTDAGPTLEQIQAEQRAALLPFEQQLAAQMETIKSLQAQMADQARQIEAQKNIAGPPAVEQYANTAAALVKAHADANPDLGPDVFAGPLATAAALKDAATAAVSSQDPTELSKLASEIEGWARSFRGKHLDLSGLLADLELLAGAAAKLGI